MSRAPTLQAWLVGARLNRDLRSKAETGKKTAGIIVFPASQRSEAVERRDLYGTGCSSASCVPEAPVWWTHDRCVIQSRLETPRDALVDARSMGHNPFAGRRCVFFFRERGIDRAKMPIHGAISFPSGSPKHGLPIEPLLPCTLEFHTVGERKGTSATAPDSTAGCG